jgi:Ca2+-binding EF-hand superfamily protein
MLKKTLSALVLTAFAASTLTACGGTDTIATMPVLEQTEQQVGALSFSGVKDQVTKALTAQFKALDADKNKMVTPEEYGVKSPEDFQAFRGLDDNKDGKVTLKEMLPGFIEKQITATKIMHAANALFKQIDSSKDGFIQMAELNNSPLVSGAFAENFKKFDKEKKIWLFRKSNSGKLSKSEFQNAYASIAMSAKADAPAPAPAEPPAAPPAEPPAAPPADPATPAS